MFKEVNKLVSAVGDFFTTGKSYLSAAPVQAVAVGSTPSRPMEDPFAVMTEMATAHEATEDVTARPESGGRWFRNVTDDQSLSQGTGDYGCPHYWD